MSNRLAIYVHNNKEGEVPEYVLYCLKGLKEVVKEILVVINGTISDSGIKKLNQISVKVLVRDNTGFDWSAWKSGIEYYGYRKISTFNEVLLTNNTFYGPIYPFSEMWQKMDKISCDFWGINRHRETDMLWIPNDPKSKMLSHIQSYWIVFRKSILRSKTFQEYWESQKPHQNYAEMVGYGETKLTAFFEKKGFKSATYMDFEKYDYLTEGNPCFLTDKQVIDDRIPIIKRKYLYHPDFYFFDTLHHTNFGPKKLLNYVKRNTAYPISFIWKDLLKSASLSDLNKRLSLNLILSENTSTFLNPKYKSVVIMYIYPIDKIDYCLKYAKNIPENIDIIIVNTSHNVQEKCKQQFSSLRNKITYKIQENRGRDNSALLVTCKEAINQYDFICFVHSKKSPHFQLNISGENFCDHCFDSLLYSENYICNIVNSFIENPALGILMPFVPNSGPLKGILGDGWTCNKSNVYFFLKDILNIPVNLDENPIFPVGGMYWFRKKALKKLFDYHWKTESFPKEPLKNSDGLLTHTIERSICYIAQDTGFYSSYVAPSSYAEHYLNNFLYWPGVRTSLTYQNQGSLSKLIRKRYINLFGIHMVKIHKKYDNHNNSVKKIKLCGVPFLKIKRNEQKRSKKIYFLGIPLIKYKRKQLSFF